MHCAGSVGLVDAKDECTELYRFNCFDLEVQFDKKRVQQTPERQRRLRRLHSSVLSAARER